MNQILWSKVIIGIGLFAAWMLLEYKPPADKDVDSLKNFIKMVLAGLVGNFLPNGM